jgi:bacterioferritin
MKGNKELILDLNNLLADELTAINQYMVHAELCKNWGYIKLNNAIRTQALEEMHHASWLIERIIFLDGSPTVSKLNLIKIGKSVEEIINSDANEEHHAVISYNLAIQKAREVSDQVTVDLLSKILSMEEKHLDWGEIQQSQIKEMTLPIYLQSQIEA